MKSEYKNIILNGVSERYEIDGISLTCGTQLEILFDGKDYEARVEYSDRFERGYYVILFPEDSKPFNKSLDECYVGRLLG